MSTIAHIRRSDAYPQSPMTPIIGLFVTSTLPKLMT